MSLVENIYSELQKTTDKSDKFYNIHLASIQKGDSFSGEDKSSTQNGYEVYSFFGRMGGEGRRRHIGFFYSSEAANRAANRIRESKIQKGYLIRNAAANENSKKIFMDVKTKKKNTKPLFDKLPTTKPKMTTNQKSRFSSLID